MKTILKTGLNRYCFLILFLVNTTIFAVNSNPNSSSLLDSLLGKTGSSKIKNGLLIFLIAYNTFEIGWRRISKLLKQNGNNLLTSQNSQNTDPDNLDFLEVLMGDLGIVTQEKLEEYVDEILLKKYPHISKIELLKVINSSIDEKLLVVIDRISKLEKPEKIA